MCVEINTTRDISAQILRHRSFSFQEYSLRYSKAKDLGNIPLPDLRLQDLKNRQNSIPVDPDCEIREFQSEIESLYQSSTDLYTRMLDAGIAKECARKILPLNTPTRLYMSGTIRSWIHYVQVRGDVSTQVEHREIALMVKEIMGENLPTIFQSLLVGE